MYFDDDLYPEGLKSLFLETAVEMVPELCAGLQGEPFRLYKSLPPGVAPHKWGGYSTARNTLPFKQLSAAIEAWATKWNLGAEWCKSAAYFTIQMWSDLGQPENFILLPPFSKAIARVDPPAGLPMYRQEFGRRQYLKTLRDTAKEAINNDPVLKHAPASRQNVLIESILKSNTITRYCDEVEAVRELSQRKAHIEATRRVDGTCSDKGRKLQRYSYRKTTGRKKGQH